MRNFIIFFSSGKEGTTPVVHLLDAFEGVSVVHQSRGGWEPFDRHNCGRMAIRDLERCLRLLYGPPPVDMDALNRVYTKTATKPLAAIAPNSAVGFKMRFRPPSPAPFRISPASRWTARAGRAALAAQRGAFQRRMLAVLGDLDVSVFVVVRQDLLRWALSKYHGDGTGQPGHLQFALVKKEIQRDEVGPIHVDLPRLGSILERCRQQHERKRRLVADLGAAGIRTEVLRYEDFLYDRVAYFTGLLGALEIEMSAGEVENVLLRGTTFEKVHSDDLAELVENHREVLDAFGDAFVAW